MRIDTYLCSQGFCKSRSKAQKALAENRVTVNGKTVNKASFEVGYEDKIELLPSSHTEFVGRGGNKLEHALDFFEIDPTDKICVDIGASTGGFTQCLLMRGAKCVFAVDSGKEQLASELLSDKRVISIEGFNARNLTVDELSGNEADIVVMDVSFISQKLLYEAILRVAKKNADIVTLIKPQFEVGKANIGKKGIVKDEKVRKKAVEEVIECAKQSGFEYVSFTNSPILGGDGNEEFLLHLRAK